MKVPLKLNQVLILWIFVGMCCASDS